MQTTSSAMIDDLLAVIGKHKSNFVGFYDDISELQDAQPTPPEGLQAIVLIPSEFYYHATGGSWVKFAPVGEVHPSYIGAYDTLQDLQTAHPSPSDGDVAIIGKRRFYIYASGSWDALITSSSGTESAQVTKNAADISKLKTDTKKAGTQSKTNHDEILKLRTVLALTRATLQNIDPRPIFEYRGATIPTLPNKPQSAYFIDVYAMQQNGRIDLPYFPDAPVRAGTVFFLSNSDSNNTIRIYGQNSETISGATSLTLPPGNVIAIAKTPTGWQTLFNAYMPPARSNLLSDLRNLMADDLHTTPEIEAIINNWLANPTTKANLDTIMQQLGYTKTGSGTGPHPSTVRVHYGASDSYPTDFTGETGEVAPHEEMTITGLDGTPSKVWIAVPQTMATKVAGISANGGLPARWAFSKIDVNGVTWTVYQSPTQLADSSLDLRIIWRI